MEDELNWKWWENKKEINHKKVKEELIDILFFTFSLCNYFNLSEKEIRELYIKKYKKNIVRLAKEE